MQNSSKTHHKNKIMQRLINVTYFNQRLVILAKFLDRDTIKKFLPALFYCSKQLS